MKVKICGITHPEDAQYAARQGAAYIGMIFSERSRRRVSLEEAKKISESARECGAEPVGVFLEHTQEQIFCICEDVGIDVVQLHGSEAKRALKELLRREYKIIYAVTVGENGGLQHKYPLPASVISLYDTAGGGTGIPFCWEAFSPPSDTFWMLAGGLNPGNIKKAITLLRPGGVDVATGVEIPKTTRKDPELVKLFIQEANNIEEKI